MAAAVLPEAVGLDEHPLRELPAARPPDARTRGNRHAGERARGSHLRVLLQEALSLLTKLIVFGFFM